MPRLTGAGSFKTVIHCTWTSSMIKERVTRWSSDSIKPRDRDSASFSTNARVASANLQTALRSPRQRKRGVLSCKRVERAEVGALCEFHVLADMSRNAGGRAFQRIRHNVFPRAAGKQVSVSGAQCYGDRFRTQSRATQVYPYFLRSLYGAAPISIDTMNARHATLFKL
jgi:hypothetical protein